MGPDHGAADDEVFHVRVAGEMLMHQFPDALICPAGKPFVDAVPVPEPGWQETPLGAGTGNPQRRLNETPAFRFPTNIETGATPQEIENLIPLLR
jgi:hypothetical protein